MIQKEVMDRIVTSRIQRLPEDLVNKIAAGEVVERPASAVKELVENALDAQADRVAIDIEGGGREFIRVHDNGHGMGRADAEHALERHATSKLRSMDDLAAIATKGFRGEALSAVASVSHLLLKTREELSPSGTEVEVSHGRLMHIRDAGHPVGTTIEVRDLFGAVPARRKFLRADSTEAGHVAEVITLQALACFETGFFLTSSGRMMLQAPAVESLAARIYQVFGGEFLAALVPVDLEESWVHVYGFISRVDQSTSSRASLRLFVNGRPVRDRILSKSVMDAFHASGGGNRRPEACLFIETPLHMVDVNVHPAKTEVRFAEPRTIWLAADHAIRKALSQSSMSYAPQMGVGRVQEAPDDDREGRVEGQEKPWGIPLEKPTDVASSFGLQQRIWGGENRAIPLGLPKVIGQHRNTYIVVTDGDDLILLDQHTAHERVRFEELREQVRHEAAPSQRLLTPTVLTLPVELRPILEEHQETLAVLGFEVEAFGGDSFRLRTVPISFLDGNPSVFFTSLLRDLLEREATDWVVSDAQDRLTATLACHSAIRAGTALSLDTMTALIRALEKTVQPATCPHGRPTRVRIPQVDVSRWFGRSGWKRT